MTKQECERKLVSLAKQMADTVKSMTPQLPKALSATTTAIRKW